jgi:hypothetical protein
MIDLFASGFAVMVSVVGLIDFIGVYTWVAMHGGEAATTL